METGVKNEYVIDAKGQRLGRVATQAAAYLLGKNDTAFVKHTALPVSVTINNASALDISEKKLKETFQTFSGYPSGRKVETLAHLAGRRGHQEVLRRVIKGMLPKNKLQKIRLQNLIIND